MNDDLSKKLLGADVAPISKALEAYRQQGGQIKAMTETGRALAEYARVHEGRFKALHRSIFTPELQGVLASHAHLTRVLAADSGIARILREQTELSRKWEHMVFPKLAITETLAALQASTAPMAQVFRQMEEMRRATELTRGLLADAPFHTLGSAVHLADGPRQRMMHRMVDMSDAFAGLQDAVQGSMDLQGLLGPTAARPAIEVFANAHLIHAVTVTGADEPEAAAFASEVEDQAQDALLPLLDWVSPELRRMWVGGAQALESGNPDRLRHFSTSMRELITHVFQHLAPDDEVQGWTSEPTHYHNGRPTRKARLLYIYRGIGSPQVADFVNRDVASVAAFIDLFQRGVHGEEVAYTDAQAFAFRLRMEGVLRYMIELARLARS